MNEYDEPQWVWPRLSVSANTEDIVRHIIESDTRAAEWRMRVDHELWAARAEIRENTLVTKEIRDLMAWGRITKKVAMGIIALLSVAAAVFEAFFRK